MPLDSSEIDWQPSAKLETLRYRAQFLQSIRDFFAKREVLEVDPPLLSQGVATDPLLSAFQVETNPIKPMPYFLQTSPEFAMKRLLAAGSGPIYALGKAFRYGEVGRKHNPEFTLLEWYRLGWDHIALIKEVDALFQHLLNTPEVEIVTYQSLFEKYFNLQPHLATDIVLKEIALEKGWAVKSDEYDKDGWLDLLLSHGIEPYLGEKSPIALVDYPATQASLAKTRLLTEGKHTFAVADRFEFYYQGKELANGYHELICAKEQRQRFETDLALRQQKQLETLPIDERLLAALEQGLPACAGVAVGIDRLLMIKLGLSQLEEVLPFAWERA
jgi:elongation factor P--(R)-beta-lysine ligase